jgi:hypothetical protein
LLSCLSTGNDLGKDYSCQEGKLCLWLRGDGSRIYAKRQFPHKEAKDGKTGIWIAPEKGQIPDKIGFMVVVRFFGKSSDFRNPIVAQPFRDPRQDRAAEFLPGISKNMVAQEDQIKTFIRGLFFPDVPKVPMDSRL